MYSEIVAGTMGIVGIIIGWSLNAITSYWKNKPRLCFVLRTTENQSRLSPPKLRDKYSESEYDLIIYNIGSKPLIIEHLDIYYNGRIIVPHLDINDTILPHEKFTYNLSEQENSDLQYHCQKDDIKLCDIIAYDVRKKIIKGSLDIESLNVLLNTRKTFMEDIK